MTSFYYCASAIGDSFPAFQELPDKFVLLESLEFIEGTEVRVTVSQVDNQPQGYLIIIQVVHIRSAQCLAGELNEGPSNGMPALSGYMVVWLDLPDFLKAYAIVLRI